MCNTYCFSTVQMVARTRFCVTFYAHCVTWYLSTHPTDTKSVTVLRIIEAELLIRLLFIPVCMCKLHGLSCCYGYKLWNIRFILYQTSLPFELHAFSLLTNTCLEIRWWTALTASPLSLYAWCMRNNRWNNSKHVGAFGRVHVWPIDDNRANAYKHTLLIFNGSHK